MLSRLLQQPLRPLCLATSVFSPIRSSAKSKAGTRLSQLLQAPSTPSAAPQVHRYALVASSSWLPTCALRIQLLHLQEGRTRVFQILIYRLQLVQVNSLCADLSSTLHSTPPTKQTLLLFQLVFQRQNLAPSWSRLIAEPQPLLLISKTLSPPPKLSCQFQNGTQTK